MIYVGSGEGLQRPDLSVGDGLYRSADGDNTWARVTTDDRPAGRIGGGDLPVPVFHPKNADIVFMASTVSWKSVDGGKTWGRSAARRAAAVNATLAKTGQPAIAVKQRG